MDSGWINKSKDKISLTIDFGEGQTKFEFDPLQGIVFNSIFDFAVKSLAPQLTKVDPNYFRDWYIYDTGESAWIEE
jgi:hypothetical protein